MLFSATTSTQIFARFLLRSTPMPFQTLLKQLTPGDILDCVAAGVDLFDGAYPVQVRFKRGLIRAAFVFVHAHSLSVYTQLFCLTQVTAEGYALCFPLQPGQSPPAGPPDAGSGRDDTKMNLWSTAYRYSFFCIVFLMPDNLCSLCSLFPLFCIPVQVCKMSS